MNVFYLPTRRAACLGLITLLSTTTGWALDTTRADVHAFVTDLSQRHGFTHKEVEILLSQSKSQEKILEAMRRPAEKTKAWHEYRGIFITPERIAAGKKFRAEQAERLNRIAADTGVPAEIIAAIVGVETYFGRITGRYRVLDALGTLGFDYPPRAKFFRRELAQFFLLTREEGLDITEIQGSYAGAMGPPQFIPSSYRAYAVDGDGDGRRDLLSNWDDILASVANYFVAHGWQSGEPIAACGKAQSWGAKPHTANKLDLRETLGSLQKQGLSIDLELAADTPVALFEMAGETAPEYWVGFKNFYVITRYNRSAMYALAVFQLSEALRNADEPTLATNCCP